MKKYITLLLVVLMLLPALVACRDNGASADTTQNPADTTSADTTGELKDNLPDNLNYNGATITLLGWTETFNEFGQEEKVGDPIYYAIYNRDRMVEQRLGIKMEQINTLINYAPDVIKAIQPSILSQDHAYDILRTHSQTPGQLALNNLLVNLRDLEYIDFDKPWWSPEYTEAAKIEGKIYFATGDISPSFWRMMYMNYCNYDLLRKYDLADPQQLAIEGEWTLDKQLEMVTGIYEDLNQNDNKDSDDLFGIMSTYAVLDAYFYSTGANIVEKDAEGQLSLSNSFGGEKVVQVIEKLGSFFNTNSGFITNTDYGKITREGRALFINCEVYFSEKFLTEADYTFKVLPVPKFSDDQKNYPIVLSNPFSVYSIPADARDVNMSAAVMEAMASESYRSVTPVMYEQLIKLRYVGSETDSAMIDIIRQGLTFDTARMFSNSFTDFEAFRRHVQNNLTTWASTVAGFSDSYRAVIDNITNTYKTLK